MRSPASSRGDLPSRRVWGQRPGQPDEDPPRRSGQMGKPKKEDKRPDKRQEPNRDDQANAKPKAGAKPKRRAPEPYAMELTFTGRGLQVTDEMREAATHKLGRLQRLEPRAVRLDLEIINEHHPRPDALKRIDAKLHTPRKTFRARAEASEVPAALDDVVERLERQLRDHHGKRRTLLHRRRAGLESAHPSAAPADTSE